MHGWLIFTFLLRVDSQRHFFDAKIVTCFEVNVDRFIWQQNRRFGGADNLYSWSLIGNHLQITTWWSSIDQSVQFCQLHLKTNGLTQFHRALIGTSVSEFHRQPIRFAHHQSCGTDIRFRSDFDF